MAAKDLKAYERQKLEEKVRRAEYDAALAQRDNQVLRARLNEVERELQKLQEQRNAVD